MHKTKQKNRLNSRKYSNMEPIHQCCRNMLKQATHHENFSSSSLICPTMQPPKIHIQGAPSSLAPINGNSQKLEAVTVTKCFQVLSPKAHRHGTERIWLYPPQQKSWHWLCAPGQESASTKIQNVSFDKHPLPHA